MNDLFSNETQVIDHGEGLYQIKSLTGLSLLQDQIDTLSKVSPFRHMMTPMGHPMKVSTLNCGTYGWVSQLSGYGYSSIDPLTHQSWPNIPQSFTSLHEEVISMLPIASAQPNACLINRYEIGTSMGRHQDKDERDFSQPIVSVSLGLSAVFQVFGKTRQGKVREFLLEDGDIFVLSGESRKFYHGIKTIRANPLNPNSLLRYNLTFRYYQAD